MYKENDRENGYTCWTVKLFDSLGEKVDIEQVIGTKKPDIELVSAEAKNHGYDSFELIETNENIIRYCDLGDRE